MRKIGIGIFCVALCLAIALILPHLGRSSSADIDDLFKWELLYFGAHSADGGVDDSNCLSEQCHSSSDLHTKHPGSDNCTVYCHEGSVGSGNVNASKCILCHPRTGGTGECPLVNLHDPGKGATCLTSGCHDGCAAVTTTTTTAAVTSTTTTSPAGPCVPKEIYGENSVEVELLRYFRDNVLSATPEGQEIIRLYYQWSPVIVMAIRNDEAFGEEVKEMIDGILLLIMEEAE